ncbi:MAG: hypothetical protein NC344_10195 [Bacteroidales bacterium]|nr:hypothetical protein [Bacteroidales bacterium]MCM1148174.1 hypothetical protein [Bacteroidales bacterium]MCM1207099.1 hypothetical protein [Bacillota bacterium]MCM1510851.1 hypothetical protein [Clostridium sp.]
MSIEKRTSEAVLQQPAVIKIGKEEYRMPKPTVGTIIMVSELVSSLPYSINADEDILHHVLANARDMKPLGRIVAVLLLGAQAVVAEEKKGLSARIFRRGRRRADELAEKVLLELSPREMAEIVAKAIESLDIAFFFGIITSLTRVNVLMPTKKASQTTVSGR